MRKLVAQCLHSESKTGDRWYSFTLFVFYLFFQSGMSAHEMMPFTFRAGLVFSAKHFRIAMGVSPR